jgi:poly-beta-1,6-N-acetyl-D-glucosamine synthase
VPAHNEEDNLPLSLPGAVCQVGPENVYVVDDNSSDRTAQVALGYTKNVYSTARGGKGAAVLAGIERFGLLDGYEGVLVLDADSRLTRTAMEHYERELEPGVAAVIGYLEVLAFQKGPIAAWRRCQYFYLTSVYMRGAVAYGGGFPVTPGFCTVYSTEAMRKLDPDPAAPTEDIDFCWQIHRKRLGEVRYAKRAHVETGVPLTLKDYIKQIKRWDRGWHYATRKYRMPLGLQWVDLVAGLMTLEMYLMWARAVLLLVFLALGLAFGVYPTVFGHGAATLLAASLVFDAAWMAGLGLISSFALRNGKIMLWVPVFPVFFCLDLALNLYAAMTLKSGLNAVWEPPERAKEVKRHSTSVEDPVYERVFGDGADGAAPNGRSEAQEAEALPSMIQSPRKRSLLRRVLVYILAPTLAFVLAASVGAMAALMVQGDLSLPGRGEPRPSAEQADTAQHQRAGAGRSQQEKAADQQEEAAVQQETVSQQNEAEYVARVGDIQANSVEAFLDNHDKLVPYDALTAGDVEEMQLNQAALKEFTDQVDGLDPPQENMEQYEVFSSAINELHEAAQIAYTLAADPTAATQSGFDEYDRHVNEATASLQRSNEILGRDYKTIEGAQSVSPLS